MSHYSTRKRLVHILFGGSAIWLGTTFCSPLAATDLELPPTPASAPDALASPESTLVSSAVPATPVEGDTPTHWDTGPTPDECAGENEYVWEDEYSDEFYSKYDYASSEETYASDASQHATRPESEQASCSDPTSEGCDEACCGKSAYESADEYAYETETNVAEEAADTEEKAGDDFWYDEEEYCYEDEYDCGDEAELSTPEVSQPEEPAVAENLNSDVEDEFSYEFDDYEMYYSYEGNRAEAVEESGDAEEVAEEVAEPSKSEWEDYYYEDEYQYYHAEYEGDSEAVAEDQVAEDQVAEEMSAEETMMQEAQSEEMWAEEYGYDGYEYQADHEDYEYDSYEDDYDCEFGMEDEYEMEAASEEAADVTEQAFEKAGATEQYGNEYDIPSEWMEAEPELDLDLLRQQPADLLEESDIELIQSLRQVSEEPAAVRRARLNNHIEAIGFEAIDFAYRYEDSADADVLTLSDDLPGLAAFLASFRLVEKGEISMDDGVVVLESALSELSLDWIESVSRMAMPTEEVVSASHPVVLAMAAAANSSIEGIGELAASLSLRFSELPWAELSKRLSEIRSAFRPLDRDDNLTL